jgi:beta-glucosidase
MAAFPGSFWWGTAASSTESEGAAPGTDWGRWEDLGRVPPSGDGNGFGTRFREDFGILVGLGLTHHRLGIDWARVEPADGRVDGAAVEHYRSIVRAGREAGLEVWAALHDVTLPGWFVDLGGFADDRARYRWARHVDRVADLLGDEVGGWLPIVEPSAYARRGFLEGSRPPGRRDPEQMAATLRGTWLAWRDAWRLLRGGPPVCTAWDLAPVFAADHTIPARTWAGLTDDVLWGVPIRALRDGILDIPGVAEEAVPDLQGSADLVGFTYEGAVAVDAGGSFVPYPPGARVAATGVAPWSEGLGLTVRRLAEQLPGRPLVVAAHGVGTTEDDWRSEVIGDGLGVLADCLADGADVRGYFHRTGVDGYAWEHGFAVPYGIIERDRTPKPSAQVLSAATHP